MLFSLDSWNNKLKSLYARASLVTPSDTEVSRILAFHQLFILESNTLQRTVEGCVAGVVQKIGSSVCSRTLNLCFRAFGQHTL